MNIVSKTNFINQYFLFEDAIVSIDYNNVDHNNTIYYKYLEVEIENWKTSTSHRPYCSHFSNVIKNIDFRHKGVFNFNRLS